MAHNKTEAQDPSQRVETATIPAVPPAAAPAGVAAIVPARARIGAEPKRLSKGQRKYLRRQKEAHEANTTVHRRGMRSA